MNYGKEFISMDKMKNINLQLPVYLFDKLLDIAKEYNVDSEVLLILAVERLLETIDFTRDLRTGKYNPL
jgi:hypothetical protein